MAPRFIARQLSHPVGIMGRVIGHLMNRHNAKMNAFAMRLLDPTPDDRVLEVGFGGGVNLPVLIQSGALVAGIDRSALVVSRANAKFAEAVAAGRAEFREGSVEALSFAAASFGKVLTVNTVYFWTSLDAGLGEIRRVLVPGGRVIIGFLPKDRMDRMGMPADIFTTRAPDDVVAALARTGFIDARIERPEPTTPWNVLVARRGPAPAALRLHS
jgi:arsenite methyltransferase